MTETTPSGRVDLEEIDRLVSGPWDRPVTWRQPVHTVYIPVDRMEGPDTPRQWGSQCLDTLRRLDLDPVAELDLDPRVAELALAKLRREPVEDVRIDFEDGFTQRGVPTGERDADEDARAEAAGPVLAGWLAARGEDGETAPPPFVGARIKSQHPEVRERGLRTLRILLGAIAAEPGAVTVLGEDPRALRLTLPKVQHHRQVAAFVAELAELERELGLPRLGFEVQVETPQAIISPVDGRMEPARIIAAGAGRVISLHYGTYDYSASLGVDPAWQAMDHPVADFAKDVLQAVTAGTGVELSDGSTNRVPAGDREDHLAAWRLHLSLVRRHLRRAIRQGWDLHPNQLFTRHAATIGHYRAEWEEAAQRLHDYVAGDTTRWMDEPATAKAMAGFLSRAAACGAITAGELATAGVSEDELRTLHRKGRL